MTTAAAEPMTSDRLPVPIDGPGSVPSDDAHPSTAAIAGHPLHPSVVPVPIGMLVAATLSDVAFTMTRDPFFARGSRWLLRGAAVSGAVAGTLGAIDFSTIRAARQPIGIAHAAGNATILGLTLASLALRRESRTEVPPAAMAISLAASGLLALTGWLGGELSYRKRVGVVPRGR
jgi:uncharacterized membrane protein